MEKTSPDVLSYTHVRNTIEEKVIQIHNGLESSGYVHISERMSEQEFQWIAERLGTVNMRSDLRIDPNKDAAQDKLRIRVGTENPRPSIYKHLPLDFHMDSPRDVRLAWYCIRQDEKYGALWLLDSRNILKHFTVEEKEILSTVQLRYIHIEDGKEYHPNEAMLVNRNGVEEVYFAEWHLVNTYSERQINTVEKFKKYLQEENKLRKMSIRLNPGESIFVNNKRMLHARGMISENSKRHIVRLALSSFSN